MINEEIVTGQQTSWALIKKLGEGDAGEVYQVETLVGMRRAILKRPQKSAFSGDVARQAAQIRAEEKILKTLGNYFATTPELHAGVPGLVDQSRLSMEFGDRLFIILEQASGFDLATLARVSKMGLSPQNRDISLDELVFLEGISRQGKVPQRILLKVLDTILALFEKIHFHRFDVPDVDVWGIVWNDVKPEHLFWDPKRGQLTLIDWGNSQFLEADGTTNDRQHSQYDDYRQLFEEMDRYMALAAPELRERLEWPARIQADNSSSEALQALKVRIQTLMDQEDAVLVEARETETALLSGDSSAGTTLEQLDEVRRQILTCGELPDIEGALRFAASRATLLTMRDQLPAVREVCAWAEGLPGQQGQFWEMVTRLVRITGRSEGVQRELFLQAIQAAICEDWEEVLWHVLSAIQNDPEPEWWFDLSDWLRHKQFNTEADGLRPLVAVNRFYFSVQSSIRQFQDRQVSDWNNPEMAEKTQRISNWLKEEIIASWTQMDPAPPHSGLAYTDVKAFLEEICLVFPEDQRALLRLLAQPYAQVDLILDSWARQDFSAARKGLRRLLLWDPDRRRVLRTEQAILAAPGWLKKVHLGPAEHEDLLEYVTTLEFEGRQLRNQTGPAGWLDVVLEGLKQMRRGVWPGDLVATSPILLHEMPWLKKFVRREEIFELEKAAFPGEMDIEIPLLNLLKGVREAQMGVDGEIALQEPMDAWMPEARGSSARVYAGLVKNPMGVVARAAIKFMRMDKIDYSLPLFKEEVQILSILRDTPGVTRMLECGFVQLDLGEARQFPFDSAMDKIQALGGSMTRIGVDAHTRFLEQLQDRVRMGWTPYLALEEQNQTNNLLKMCDAGLNRGQFLPVPQLVQMAIQICDILELAHARNIVYRDHKILHYYWLPESNGIYVIDWNVARYHPEGLTPIEIHMDLVQFGARGLHHILTGRAAPGALPLGPTRPEEIEQAAQSYRAQWTYDDQRLPFEIKEILERVLAGEYASASALREDLKNAYMQHPNDN